MILPPFSAFASPSFVCWIWGQFFELSSALYLPRFAPPFRDARNSFLFSSRSSDVASARVMSRRMGHMLACGASLLERLLVEQKPGYVMLTGKAWLWLRAWEIGRSRRESQAAIPPTVFPFDKV